jgi:DNA polymerase-3 subunit beta
VGIAVSEGKVSFQSENLRLDTQLIDAQFPAYEGVIPQSHKTRAVLSKAAFLTACKQAAIFAEQDSLLTRLQITPANTDIPGTLRVSAESAETGAQQAELVGEIRGEPLQIAFNVRFLQDALKVIDADEIALETTDPAHPGLIRPVGMDGFLHVLMPMHLD